MTERKTSFAKIAIVLVLIALSLTLIAMPALAKSKAKLSRTKLTLKAGTKATLTLKGYSGKAKWSVSGKKLVSIKTSGKKKHKAVIKAGKKSGTCYVKVKAGRKILKCKVKVTGSGKSSEEEFKEKELTGDATDISKDYVRGNASGKEADDAFKGAVNGTSLSMLKYLIKENAGKNVLISPDSILTAMAMVENGASGNTLSQMETAFGGIKRDDYMAYLSALNDRVAGSKEVRYNIANSIWYRDSSDFKLEVKDEFIQSNLDYFNSQLFTAPFTALSVADMNTWVYNKTRGMIPKIIERLNDDDVMVLINAICFEGDWVDPYIGADNGNFRKEDGTKQKAAMLNGTEFTLVKVGNALGFVKPYQGGDLAFLGIETPEGMTLDEFINSLSASDITEGYKNRRTENVKVLTKMPKFQYDFDASLVKMMQNLGITDAFGGAADFSGISNYPLAISEILHKTHIEVTEDGTKAAAATAVQVAKNSAPPQNIETYKVDLDHPFLYAIIDQETGIPLFIGIVREV